MWPVTVAALAVANEIRRRVPDIAGKNARPTLQDMKAIPNRLQEARHERAAAMVEEHVRRLFRRMPMLSGFSMRHDLEMADVAVHSWPGHVPGPEFYEAVADALAELINESAEAREILRGRTFARAIH